MSDLPATIVAATVWTYWLSVLSLVVRSHLRFRTAAGAVPQTSHDKRMWRLWVPVILLWQVLPLLGAESAAGLWGLPELARQAGIVQATRLAAAAIGVLALAGTFPCWLGMGSDWSMAVVPGKACRLIKSGMFARVRHPIYALSILLMLATMVAVPTPAMIVVGLVHVGLLYGKARSEENYLHGVHGRDYAAYCQVTGRFLPRFFSASQSLATDQQARGSEERRRAA